VDLRYSESDERFRKELREWLGDVLPTLPPKPDPDDWPARRAWDTGWQRMLFDAGYAGINWPVEYGGRGATLTEQLIFLEETTLAGAPYIGVNFVGLLHAGPTLMAEASEEQKRAHLPRILRGEEVWCQGFSEPGAGSDLAALSCRAVRDGDEYVITGQKIWTSFAQVADYCELLVRTDPDAPKHRGITWLIFPMDTPGIEIRGITTIVGSSEFSEVFFDGARVPVTQRVGAENDGWRIAMVTFGFERGTGFISDLVETNRMIGDLAVLARRVTRRSGTAWDDVALRRELGRLQAEMDALWAMTKRNLAQAERHGVPGPAGSVVKVAYLSCTSG
jgi:alkylation response protein AidB-like acyl-CoA dehydrogenase